MSNRGAERILAVQNPVCSRAGKAQEAISWLMDSRWAGDLEVLQTIPPSEGSNTELIREALEPGVTVLSLGGDGLAHDTFNAVRDADAAGEVGADEVSIVPVPTGSGNDLSRSLYGGNILRHRRQRLWDILDHGQKTWLDGMKLEADGRLDRFVHSYIGFGFTGQAAAAINEPEFRARRAGINILPGRALDAAQVLRVLIGRRPFVYENGSGPREAQEMLYAIIPRVAAGVIRLNTHPLDGEIVHVELGSKAFFPQVVAKLGSGLLGGAKGELVSGQSHELKFHTPTAIQYDGEPDELPAGSTVHISHRRDVVQALVT